MPAEAKYGGRALQQAMNRITDGQPWDAHPLTDSAKLDSILNALKAIDSSAERSDHSKKLDAIHELLKDLMSRLNKVDYRVDKTNLTTQKIDKVLGS